MVFFVFSVFYPFGLSVHAVYVLLGTLTPGGGAGVGGSPHMKVVGMLVVSLRDVISDFGLI